MSELGQDLSGDFSTAMEVALGRFRGDNCRPEFYQRSVHFENESEAAGRPVFKNVEYVRITIPGQRMSAVDRKVRDEDKRRWPREYLAWKQSGTMSTDGMPLEKWTLISPAEVDTLKHYEVRTVEELANLSDSQTQTCGMGTLRLRGLAQDWVKQARDNTGLSQVHAKNKALEEKVDLLTGQLAQLLARVNKSEGEGEGESPAATPPARKRGGRRAAAQEAEGTDPAE